MINITDKRTKTMINITDKSYRLITQPKALKGRRVIGEMEKERGMEKERDGGSQARP